MNKIIYSSLFLMITTSLFTFTNSQNGMMEDETTLIYLVESENCDELLSSEEKLNEHLNKLIEEQLLIEGQMMTGSEDQEMMSVNEELGMRIEEFQNAMTKIKKCKIIEEENTDMDNVLYVPVESASVVEMGNTEMSNEDNARLLQNSNDMENGDNNLNLVEVTLADNSQIDPVMILEATIDSAIENQERQEMLNISIESQLEANPELIEDIDGGQEMLEQLQTDQEENMISINLDNTMMQSSDMNEDDETTMTEPSNNEMKTMEMNSNSNNYSRRTVTESDSLMNETDNQETAESEEYTISNDEEMMQENSEELSFQTEVAFANEDGSGTFQTVTQSVFGTPEDFGLNAEDCEENEYSYICDIKTTMCEIWKAKRMEDEETSQYIPCALVISTMNALENANNNEITDIEISQNSN